MKTLEDLKKQKVEDLPVVNVKAISYNGIRSNVTKEEIIEQANKYQVYGVAPYVEDDFVLVRISLNEASWVLEYRAKDFESSPEKLMLMAREGTPTRFQDADFFMMDKKLQKAAEKIIDGEKKGLYLFGGCGCGKTYSVWAMYQMFRFNEMDIKVESMVDILYKLKKDFNSSDPKYYDFIRNYKGVLVIDDLGSEKITDWAMEMFYSIINKRYEENRTTIITSNLSIEEISKKYGDRLASRIVGMCDIIKIEGEDKRL